MIYSKGALSCYFDLFSTRKKFPLRYHGRWIFKKNAKNLFFAVQIEKTEKNNLQKEWRKKHFYFLNPRRRIDNSN